MDKMISRREFVGSAVAMAAMRPWRIFAADGFGEGAPKLRFGVVSDVHVCEATGTYGTEHLFKAFVWFRDQGVDGVIIAGDMADHGLIAQLQCVADAWNKAFPGGKGLGGKPVEKLFVYGNHDIEGFKYPKIKFLNCSINLAHHAVRTYYAKLYEAKFLAGIVAGSASAADGTHMIGYCSDYPIFGTIASINAFAIGAAMADPQVKIYLDWTAKQDNNWWWNMVDKGIHVISAIDSMHNTDGTNAYGVCYVEEVEPGLGTDQSGRCRITNLAAPIWKWGKLYEIIVRTIMDGTYHSSLVDKKDKATNYWWGMMSGVVDLEISDNVSPYTKQLVDILRTDIISGSMNPFDGELRSQNGLIRGADDAPLTSMDVITMDWLNENIIGEIPERDDLTEEGKATVKVSGVK